MAPKKAATAPEDELEEALEELGDLDDLDDEALEIDDELDDDAKEDEEGATEPDSDDITEEVQEAAPVAEPEPPKRRRGRPPKQATAEEPVEAAPKRRGRPPKTASTDGAIAPDDPATVLLTAIRHKKATLRRKGDAAGVALLEQIEQLASFLFE